MLSVSEKPINNFDAWASLSFNVLGKLIVLEIC